MRYSNVRLRALTEKFLTDEEKAELRVYAQNYFEYKNTYLEEQNAQ